MIRPPAPARGAPVALVAPAGPLAPGAVERAARRVAACGREPRVAEHARGRHGFLSAPDEGRLHDLNAALREPSIAAVWCLRGGYGTMRILERIDWSALVRRPRALIGFSDNTALHLAAQRAGVVSFHGPHPAARRFSRFSRGALQRVLGGGVGPLPVPPGCRVEPVHGGVAEGPLVGGNLSLLAATLGTPFAVRARGSILFLEEVGEPGYRVDRLLTQLLLAGVLAEAAGIVVGGFTDAPADDGGPPVEEVLRERLQALGVPVAMGFPFGHVDDQWTLPLGVKARLDAGAGTLELLEPAVTGPAADPGAAA